MALRSSLRALLILCPDRVRLQDALTKSLQELGFCDAETVSFHASEFSNKDFTRLEHLLHSPSLFAEKQVFVIHQVQDLKVNLVDALLECPFETLANTLVVLTASSLKANSRLKKFFSKNHYLIEKQPLSAKDFPQWLIDQAKSLDVSLSKKVATTIMEIADCNPDEADRMVRHLCIYCDGKSPTTNDVFTVFHHHPDPNEFELLDQALSSPTEVESLRTLQDLLHSGKNPFLLLNLLGKTLSRLLSIRTLLEKKTPTSEIQEVLGISSWILSKQLPLAKQYS